MRLLLRVGVDTAWAASVAYLITLVPSFWYAFVCVAVTVGFGRYSSVGLVRSREDRRR